MYTYVNTFMFGRDLFCIFLFMQEEELLALLRDEENEEEKQTAISNEDLERVIDRSDLLVGESELGGIPLKGPGWEVVVPTATGGMLSTLNS